MVLEEFVNSFASTLSQGSFVALGVAVLAGIMTSGVCPCTLPVGIGLASVVGASETKSRRAGFMIAIFFFAGIVIGLIILGLIASQLGALLTESFGRYWALTMSLISLMAAVVAFRDPRLEVTQLTSWRFAGFVGAFVYGVIFHLGTSSAPLLLLLTVAAAQARPEYWIVLSFAFGLGRGLPFLLIGLFTGSVVRWFHRIASWHRVIQFASGCVLLLISASYAWVFISML